MRIKTALAVAGTVLASPSAALAAAHQDVLRPSGKLSYDAELKERLIDTNARLARQLDRDANVRRLRTLPVSVLRDRNARLRKRVARLVPATPAHL